MRPTIESKPDSDPKTLEFVPKAELDRALEEVQRLPEKNERLQREIEPLQKELEEAHRAVKRQTALHSEPDLSEGVWRCSESIRTRWKYPASRTCPLRPEQETPISRPSVD